MSLPTPLLSKTVQSLSKTKISELARLRQTYESRKDEILASAKSSNSHQRLKVLLAGVKALKPPSAPGHESIENIERWLTQSVYDSSIPEDLLAKLEGQLREKLELQSNRLAMGDLYARLILEWMDPPAAAVEEKAEKVETAEDASIDSFEVLEKPDRLKDLQEKFATVAFTPLETDTTAITEYLSSLFAGESGAAAKTRIGRAFMFYFNPGPLDRKPLKTCIRGLLSNSLLNDDQKVLLREFLTNDIVLEEIQDVLNMRCSDFENWTWGVESMVVEPRKQLNGKYRVVMDEDVLQAIFVHYIGVLWCVRMKNAFSETVTYTPDWWKKWDHVSSEVVRMRSLYRQRNFNDDHNVDWDIRDDYMQEFFLSSVPRSIEAWGGAYDEDDENAGNGEDKAQSATAKKHSLHRELATEALMRQYVDGEVAVIQTDLKWFGTSLSHSTLFAVLKFFGTHQEWLDFFKKFLAAPLDLGDGNIRERKRGVPMAHSLSMFFGEVVLFAFDLAVNQHAGINLYRLHDDFWLVGPPDKVAKAWETVNSLATLLGLELNNAKTGSVYISSNPDVSISSTLPSGPVSVDLLNLDPTTGDWRINERLVDAHMAQLKRQLSAAPSILAWIETWNSCIGRFFDRAFGEPAACFGKAHIDEILATHKKIQSFLFENESVGTHLKSMIESRLGITDVPDAFLYLPPTLGGLGLRNPFIPFFLARENMPIFSPRELIKNKIDEETHEYERLKKNFLALSKSELAASIHQRHDVQAVADEMMLLAEKGFPSWEEWTKYRYVDSQYMIFLRNRLREKPGKDTKAVAQKVKTALESTSLLGKDVEPELMWLVQMYLDTVSRRFGGLQIVEKRFLPLGVLDVVGRKGGGAWQMVL